MLKTTSFVMDSSWHQRHFDVIGLGDCVMVSGRAGQELSGMTCLYLVCQSGLYQLCRAIAKDGRDDDVQKFPLHARWQGDKSDRCQLQTRVQVFAHLQSSSTLIKHVTYWVCAAI